MSVEDLYVELARHKAEIAKLTGRVEAVENVVYNRQAKKTQQLPVQEDAATASSRGSQGFRRELK